MLVFHRPHRLFLVGFFIVIITLAVSTRHHLRLSASRGWITRTLRTMQMLLPLRRILAILMLPSAASLVLSVRR